MEKQLNIKYGFNRWIETTGFPIVLGLFLGGIGHMCFPNIFGLSIGIGLAVLGLVAGIIIARTRMKKNKGPVIFHPKSRS